MSSAIALWRKVAELSTKQAVYKDGSWDQDFMKFMAYHYEPLVDTSYDELSLKWSKGRYDSDPKDCGFNRGLYYTTFWVAMEKAGVFIAGGDKKEFLEKMVETSTSTLLISQPGCHQSSATLNAKHAPSGSLDSRHWLALWCR